MPTIQPDLLAAILCFHCPASHRSGKLPLHDYVKAVMATGLVPQTYSHLVVHLTRNGNSIFQIYVGSNHHEGIFTVGTCLGQCDSTPPDLPH
jgi:hypothetical protein